MIRITFRFIVVFFFLCESTGIFSQEHMVYVSGGGAISLSYEGRLSSKDKEDDLTFLRFTGGKDNDISFLNYAEQGVKEPEYYLGAAITQLIGKESGRVELIIGMTYAWSAKTIRPTEPGINLLANLGYRLVADDFMLRVGFGVPELFYLGAGFWFLLLPIDI